MHEGEGDKWPSQEAQAKKSQGEECGRKYSNNKNMTSLRPGRREENFATRTMKQQEVRVIGYGRSERQEIRGGEERVKGRTRIYDNRRHRELLTKVEKGGKGEETDGEGEGRRKRGEGGKNGG